MKNTLFLSALFILTGFNTRCQNIPDSLTSNKGWYWGITLKPSYNYRKIEGEKTDEVNFQDSVQVPDWTCDFGILFSKYFNKKIRIETGFIYSNKGYKSKEYLIPALAGSAWSGFYTSYVIINDNFYFSYLDIPVLIDYKFLNKKFSIQAGCGIVFNIFLASGNSDESFPHDYYYYLPSNSSISGEFKIGISYLSNNHEFSISSNYQQTFFSVVRSSFEKIYLYSYKFEFSYFKKIIPRNKK